MSITKLYPNLFLKCSIFVPISRKKHEVDISLNNLAGMLRVKTSPHVTQENLFYNQTTF